MEPTTAKSGAKPAINDTSILACLPEPVLELVLAAAGPRARVRSARCSRGVREAALLLDLPLEMRPCPGARAGFAAELRERTGRMTVPYLVDPNRGPDAAMCPICFCDTDPVLVLDCCNNHMCVHCANVWCWNSSHGCPYCRKRTKNLQDMFARRE